jgi:hypothetical protein
MVLVTLSHIAGWERGLACGVGATGIDYLAKCQEHCHSRFPGHGSVAMQALLPFMTDGGQFYTYFDSVTKQYILTTKHCMNMRTVFLKRRKKFGK